MIIVMPLFKNNWHKLTHLRKSECTAIALYAFRKLINYQFPLKKFCFTQGKSTEEGLAFPSHFIMIWFKGFLSFFSLNWAEHEEMS